MQNLTRPLHAPVAAAGHGMFTQISPSYLTETKYNWSNQSRSRADPRATLGYRRSDSCLGLQKQARLSIADKQLKTYVLRNSASFGQKPSAALIRTNVGQTSYIGLPPRHP